MKILKIITLTFCFAHFTHGSQNNTDNPFEQIAIKNYRRNIKIDIQNNAPSLCCCIFCAGYLYPSWLCVIPSCISCLYVCAKIDELNNPKPFNEKTSKSFRIMSSI
jgi:hypothetical protein